MEMKIVDYRQVLDEATNAVKETIYTVCCEDESGTELVEVSVPNASTTVPAEIPEQNVLDAYAAFVRLYSDWLSGDCLRDYLLRIKCWKGSEEKLKQASLEELQVFFVQEKIRAAARNRTRFTKINWTLAKSGDEMFNTEFDEFLDQTWVEYLELLSDVDAFSKKLKKDFEKRGEYPDIDRVILRNAEKVMAKTQRKAEKVKENILSERSHEDDPPEVICTVPDKTVDIDALVSEKDFVDYVRSMLAKNENRAKVFDALLVGLTVSEIAEQVEFEDKDGNPVHISKAAVSQHKKKIEATINKIII